MLCTLSIQAIRCPNVIGSITYGSKVMATNIGLLLFLLAILWEYAASACADYWVHSTVVAPLPKWIIMSSPMALLALAMNACVFVSAWASFAFAVAVLIVVAMVYAWCSSGIWVVFYRRGVTSILNMCARVNIHILLSDPPASARSPGKKT